MAYIVTNTQKHSPNAQKQGWIYPEVKAVLSANGEDWTVTRAPKEFKSYRGAERFLAESGLEVGVSVSELVQNTIAIEEV